MFKAVITAVKQPDFSLEDGKRQASVLEALVLELEGHVQNFGLRRPLAMWVTGLGHEVLVVDSNVGEICRYFRPCYLCAFADGAIAFIDLDTTGTVASAGLATS